MHLWHTKWSNSSDKIPATPSEALLHANEKMFPNLNCLFRIICTLPVTSCECERSISVLRRLKTYLRATKGEERLTGLALMHIHYAMDLNKEEIINSFAEQHLRRMVLNLLDRTVIAYSVHVHCKRQRFICYVNKICINERQSCSTVFPDPPDVR